MEDSMAQAEMRAPAWELPAWKTALCTVSAFLLAIIMLVPGIWKCTDPIGMAARLNQLLVPASLSIPAALALGISETFAGVLLLVPRFRRWGALLGGALLVAFVIYIGVFYNRLVGEECNCFPWIQRAVGPMFFVGDGLMLVLAVIAGIWARPSESLRSALMVLGAIAVFAGVSLGVAITQPQGTLAPETIAVAGEPFSLREGRVLLYFFDPECTHCLFAAQEMKEYAWNDVTIVAIPTERAFLAESFMQAAGLEAPLSSDVAKLREVYSFGDPPFAVALEEGRTLKELRVFEGDEPKASLRSLGFVGD